MRRRRRRVSRGGARDADADAAAQLEAEKAAQEGRLSSMLEEMQRGNKRTDDLRGELDDVKEALQSEQTWQVQLQSRCVLPVHTLTLISNTDLYRAPPVAGRTTLDLYRAAGPSLVVVVSPHSLVVSPSSLSSVGVARVSTRWSDARSANHTARHPRSKRLEELDASHASKDARVSELHKLLEDHQSQVRRCAAVRCCALLCAAVRCCAVPARAPGGTRRSTRGRLLPLLSR